jgi:hypothetical protein
MWLPLFAVCMAAPAKGKPPPVKAECASVAAELTEAGPGSVGKVFAQLAGCDAEAAKREAAAVFAKAIGGPGGDAAAVAAIQLGVGPTLYAWIDAQQPDERSQTIDSLGKACAAEPKVGDFFVAAAAERAARFASDRWYAGLDECRVPAVATWLGEQVKAGHKDRAFYKGMVETAARNLGKDAVPILAERIAGVQPEEAAFLVAAFADAAGVGTEAGVQTDAAVAAVAAIKGLVPSLPTKALDQARNTLNDLGAEDESDLVAGVRFKDVAQADGSLHYGAHVAKVGTCKNGDVKIEAHTLVVKAGNNTWPDQVQPRLKATLDKVSWRLPKDCQGEVVVTTSPAPLKDVAAHEAWLSDLDRALQKAHSGVRPKVIAEDPASW